MLRAIVATYREAFSGLNRSVWLLSAATLVNRSGTMVLPFLVLYLTDKLGLAPATAGRVLAVYGVGGVIGSYLGGWLCDRIEARRVMEGSLFLSGIGFLVLGQIESLSAILVTVFFLSLVAEGFRPANSTALAAASPPEQRTRSFALNRLAINVGMTLGPSIGGFLAMIDYRWLFLADGATCLLASFLLWFSFRGIRLAAEDHAPRAAAAAGARSPLRDYPFLVMLVLFYLTALITFQMFSTLPLFLRDQQGFTEAEIGLVMSINTLLIVLFEMILVHRVGGRDPLRLIGLGGLLFGLGLALLPFGSGFVYVAFTVVVWTVGEMLSFPLAAGVVANRAEEANRGRYMGLFTISFEGAFIVAPLTGTWIYQTYGANTLWYLCGAVGAVIWVGFYALSRLTSRSPDLVGDRSAAAGTPDSSR